MTDPKWPPAGGPQDPAGGGGFPQPGTPGQPPSQPGFGGGAFGAPPSSGQPFGSSPAFGAPPGQPPGGGFGAPPGQPPGGGFGGPPGQPPGGGFGGPPGQPPGGGFGGPPGQPPGGGFGGPPGQPPGGGFGAPPGQPPFGGPPGQPPFGGPPGQPPFGAPPGFGGPPSFGGMPGGFAGPPPGGGNPLGKIALAVVPMLVVGCCVVGVLYNVGRNVQQQVASAFGDGGMLVPPTGSAPGPKTADQAMYAKLDLYIDCLNGFSGRAIDSYQRYLSWADEATGPTGDERNIYGLYTLVSDPQECATKITQAAGMEPEHAEIEAAAQAYSQALLALHPLLNQADQYYTRQNYRDDGMAQGKTLHQQLIPAFHAFIEANTQLAALVETIQEGLDQRLLVQLQNDASRRMEYLIRSAIASAKAINRLNRESTVGEDRLVHGVQAAAFMAAVETFERSVDELKTYAAGHPNDASEVRMLSSYTSELDDYVVAAKGMARRLRDNAPFSDSEMRVIFRMNMGYSVDGSPMKLGRAYDELVGAYNRLW